MLGHRNIVAALYGELTYDDAKRGGTVAIKPSATVVWNRVRGLHLSQAGVIVATADERLALRPRAARLSRSTTNGCAIRSASTFRNRNPPRRRCGGTDVFDALLAAKGWQPRLDQGDGARRIASARVSRWKSSSINLRDYILGLNLGRWDYMASLIHFNLRRSAVGAARSQHDSVRRSVLSARAHAAARAHAQARRARDRRHDRALSQPRRSRAQRARARGARTRQEATKRPA